LSFQENDACLNAAIIADMAAGFSEVGPLLRAIAIWRRVGVRVGELQGNKAK